MARLDFLLPSFPPMDESVFITTSTMLDTSIRGCRTLLITFVTLKMLYDWYSGEDEGRLVVHMRTIAKLIMMLVFFAYYKTLLMYLDRFINILSFDNDVAALALEKAKASVNVENPNSWWIWKICVSFVKGITQRISQLFSMLTHGGAIYFMSYVRALGMLILIQVGPIAALLSWLPGIFSKTWQQWLKSYISVSCWAITINIFSGISKGIAAVQTDYPGLDLIQSIVLFFMIFSTPMWTAKFIGSDSLGNFTSGASNLMKSSIPRIPGK